MYFSRKNHVWNSSFKSRITFFKKVEIFRFSKKWFLKIIQKVPFFRGTCTNNSLEAKSMASFFRFASTNQHFELFLWWKKVKKTLSSSLSMGEKKVKKRNCVSVRFVNFILQSNIALQGNAYFREKLIFSIKKVSQPAEVTDPFSSNFGKMNVFWSKHDSSALHQPFHF